MLDQLIDFHLDLNFSNELFRASNIIVTPFFKLERPFRVKNFAFFLFDLFKLEVRLINNFVA